MAGLNDFYDPVSYESASGYAPRVDGVYAAQLADLTADARLMELGCGIGNVLLPFARRGVQVIGVDRSEAMLDRFRQLADAEGLEVTARVRCLRHELPGLPDVGTMDAVILPNNLIAHILDDDDLDQLWSNIAAVLKPGGRVMLDVERFDVRHIGTAAGPTANTYRTHGFSDYPGYGAMRVDEQTKYDTRSGILTCTFRYEVQGSSGEVERAWYRVLRMYPRRLREVSLSLIAAGFRLGMIADDIFPAGMDHIFVQAYRD